MLSVAEALRLIQESQPLRTPKQIALHDAGGLVLAADCHAQTDLPVFDSSAMDGFALRSADLAHAAQNPQTGFRITDEIWAGHFSEKVVAEGSCARIMTGAPMPAGADTVVMREHVQETDGFIRLTQPVKAGENVRHRGEECRKGDLLFRAGHFINAGTAGAMAAAGIAQVFVHPLPIVTVIPTGSELVAPGQALAPGQIYESNSYALRMALDAAGIPVTVAPAVSDDPEELKVVLAKALATSTHVLVTGGVSVGDKDFNKAIFGELGVEEVFWKVAQKPGKPLYYGRRGETSVFGLPGNPVSALICFYIYVYPALRQAAGRGFRGLETFLTKLTAPVRKKVGLSLFLRARLKSTPEGFVAEPDASQESHRLLSLARADILLALEPEQTALQTGDVVTALRLPEWR